VNLSVGEPSNPWTLMGYCGIFSPYPFLPAGAFGRPLWWARPPRGRSQAWCAHASRWDGAKQRADVVITAIVGVEVAICLRPPTYNWGSWPLRHRHANPVFLPRSPPEPVSFPIRTRAPVRALNPFLPPSNASWYRSNIRQACLGVLSSAGFSAHDPL
jgi:hypothetical protein